MRRLSIASAATLAILAGPAVLAGQALAADLPRRSYQQPAYNSVPPAFTWTGFYLGLNAGTVWGDFTNAGKFIDTKAGFTGGVTAGYNYQISNIVVGLEGDYNYSGMGGRGFAVPGPTFVQGDLTSFGTLRARLGMSFDRALIYATGGYAFGFSSLESGGFKSDTTHNGYVLGAGLEYAFTQNISAKAEYLYMPLDAKNSLVIPGYGAGSKTGVDANVIRAGVNYRF
jgi:outer membrane immunogenic protein